MAGVATVDRAVTVNREQALYVIPEGDGYSCLGFDVVMQRFDRLAAELRRECHDLSIAPFSLHLRGTLEGYHLYRALVERARLTGKRFRCELTPQLEGLEGNRVEVETLYGETRRFIVGKSTGWLPIHLEIKTRASTGGMGAEREYRSVRVVRPGRHGR